MASRAELTPALPLAPVRLPANAPALQEVVNQFTRRVIHLHVESFHAAGQIIEHHHGRDGDEQTDGGGYQRFGDTAGNGAQTCGLLLGNAFEGVQNADHGAEQADEGSGGADGGQAAQPALQFSVYDGFGALQSALGSFNLLAGNVAGLGVGTEFLQARGHYLSQMALLIALGYADGFVNLAFAQGARYRGSKGPRLLACGAERHPAVNHHADGPAGHDEQNDNYRLRQN